MWDALINDDVMSGQGQDHQGYMVNVVRRTVKRRIKELKNRDSNGVPGSTIAKPENNEVPIEAR